MRIVNDFFQKHNLMHVVEVSVLEIKKFWFFMSYMQELQRVFYFIAMWFMITSIL